MQYLAAATLATLGGKEVSKSFVKVDEQTLTAILNATGKPVDAAQVTSVVNTLKGKQVHELITKGQSKVGSVGGAASKGAAPAKEAPKKDEKKKEEPKVKAPEPEPEDEDMNLDLFG